MSDRKPCPFCGSDKIHRHDFSNDEDDPNAGGSCYVCEVCKASGPIVFGDKESLGWSWDRRSMPQPGTIDVDELALRLRSLIQYAEWQMEEGWSYHPTLPSAVSAAKAALRSVPDRRHHHPGDPDARD